MDHSFQMKEGRQENEVDNLQQVQANFSNQLKHLGRYEEQKIGNNKVNKELEMSMTQQYTEFNAHSNAQNMLDYFKNYQPQSHFLNMKVLHNSKKLKIKKYKEAVYYGQIVNNKRHGKGILVYDNHRFYEGEWQTDCKHGRGYEQFPNGTVYQGFYINGKPQGVGRFSWPNGQFYEGEWENGVKHGSGMWKGAKGDSYVGEWKFGKADGEGVHVWINGDKYQGQFKQSLKHGQGTETFASGDYYAGHYSYGKANGYGEYYWKNGSFYKGNFNNGLRQGQGLWKKGSGHSDKYEGEYLGDKKDGYGIFTWANGNVYKGHYQKDQRNGYGQMYWNNGSYYKGQWVNGSQHGQGQIYTPDQGLRKGQFIENELINVEYKLEPGRPITPIDSVQYKAIIRNSTEEDLPNPNRALKPNIRSRPRTYHKNQLSKQRRSSQYNIAGNQSRPEHVYAYKYNAKHNHKQNEQALININRKPLKANRQLPKFQRSIEHNIKKSRIHQLRDRILSKQKKPTHSSKEAQRILHSSLYIHRHAADSRPIDKDKNQQIHIDSKEKEKVQTINVIEYRPNRRYDRDIFIKRISMLVKQKSLSFAGTDTIL